mmetsp:Transcript_33168/g.48636  ORF Transcript_33168/g.48636 Transcript_33168/m.48636 type:complete len:232 (-) Transcript_33168:428-1123(-)
MTAYDIARIATWVSIGQLVADLLARRFVFQGEPYQRALSAFERAKQKRDKVLLNASAAANNNNNNQSNGKNTTTTKADMKALEKSAKKIQRAEDDFNEAAAEVAKKHTSPQFLTSILFLILYRVLSADYAGKVVAILPFEPWGIVQKISRRGLEDVGANAEVDPSRACAFLFVYMMCTLSVKFMVHQVVGVHPPEGVKGVSTLLDTPKSQKMLKSFGIDTDEFNEAKKAFS